MKPTTFILILFLILHSGISGLGQSSTLEQIQSKYDPQLVFSPIFYTENGSTYRTANGEPGPAYWQNKADYRIDAVLDTIKNEITGTVIITYTNNSPQKLSYLWLQLDQNAFKKGSRSEASKLFFRDTTVNQAVESSDLYPAVQSQKLQDKIKQSLNVEYGFNIKSIKLTYGERKETPADYLISDTRMKIIPEVPVAPAGGQILIKIDYSYIIPEFFSTGLQNRTDILYTGNGKVYTIAQWYPRICVFDDVEGWNTLPYLGLGEFYLEYGDFDVNITLPASYIVVASGELSNPGEVLTTKELARWKQARESPQRVFIRTLQDVNDPRSRPATGNLTWKFSMKNTRDFAWAASRAYIWEGVQINIPNGKKVFGMSVYPPESNIDSIWGKTSEYVKFTIENFSKRWYNYPYPCAVNVAAKADGMEYPGIVFCNAFSPSANAFWHVTNHELGHNWFPMIVGSNERKYAWMDEGFNTFITEIASKDLNRKELPGSAAYYYPNTEYFADSLAPIMSRPDASDLKSDEVWKVQYLKMAYVMRLLRDEIIGPERFDPAFKKYIHDWAFKHPTPWDFFRSIENSVGEDLSWYWRSMFLNNFKLDQAITMVEFDKTDPAKGTTITVDNLEKMPMPLIVKYVTKSGKVKEMKFPVEIWMMGSRYSIKIPDPEALQSVTIDPKEIFPDINRTNNSWTSQ